MFKDLVAAASLMLEVLALPEMELEKDKWRSVYAMFRLLEQVIVDADSALFQLAELQESSGSPVSVYRCNDAFAALDASSREMLRQFMSFSTFMLRGLKTDENLCSRLRFYFHPKSVWYTEFSSGYCSGKVSGDGEKISWTTLIPPTEMETAFDAYASQHDAMCWPVVEDIPSCRKRFDAIEKGQSSIAKLAEIHVAIAQMIRRSCHIEDLLHPHPTIFASRRRTMHVQQISHPASSPPRKPQPECEQS